MAPENDDIAAGTPLRTLASAEETRLPARLGRYTLQEKLGTGGMAEVFRGVQDGPAGFAKQVVVKRILPQLVADGRFVQMFLREARVAAHLTHSNIVQVYELGEADGMYFIAMELVDGISLHRLAVRSWRRGKSLPVELVLTAIADAASALSYANGALGPEGRPLDVVHRDISPDNLMIDRRGVTKVLDFGVAAAADIAPTITRTGEVKGKLPYLPPEQIQGETLTHRADIYSLGVTFYWLVCGRRPFVAKNNAALMHAIISTEPRPPSELNPSLPRELDEPIMRMLAKDPAQRPQSGAELSGQLLSWLSADRTSTAAFVKEVMEGDDPAEPSPGVPAAAPTTDSFTPRMRTPTSNPTTATGESDEVGPGVADDTPWGASAPPASVVYNPTGTLTRQNPQRRTTGVLIGISGIAVVAAFVVGVMLASGSPKEGAALPSPTRGLDAATVTTSPEAEAPQPEEPATAPPARPRPALPDESALPEESEESEESEDSEESAESDWQIEPAQPEPEVESTTSPKSASKRRTGSTSRSRSTPSGRPLTLLAPSRVAWSLPSGKSLGRGKIEARVPAGTKTLVAKDASRGSTTDVPVNGNTVDYNKLPTGEIDVRAFPFADVRSGARELGTTPFPPVRVVIGEHRLTFTHKGEKRTKTVVVKAGARAILKVNFKKP